MSILVVDPSSTRRRTVRHPLEAAFGGSVEEAESGAEALARLKVLRDVVVLTGPELGELSAPAFAAALRRHPAHAATPLLLVTPPCTHDDFLEAVDAGYEGCVLIPFEDDLLVGKVRRAFEALRDRAEPPTPTRRYRHQGFLRG